LLQPGEEIHIADWGEGAELPHAGRVSGHTASRRLRDDQGQRAGSAPRLHTGRRF
jgi:hypothetical protein